MDRKTMHVVAERLIFKAGSLVEFWSDEFAQFGEEPPCTAEEARVLLARWLQRLPGEAWDTRLDEHTAPSAPESGSRLSLEDALEYADQMRRDTTVVGLPNWPEPPSEVVASCACLRGESEVYAAHHRTVCVAAKCKHGFALKPGVTSDVECEFGQAYGVFGDEGPIETLDCATQAANDAAFYTAEDDGDTEYTVKAVCREHPEQPANGCEDCFAETDDDEV